MKTYIKAVFLLLLPVLPALHGQSWPESPNVWNNPDFVDRFMGSYGFETTREPKISGEEAELFQEIATLAETSLEMAAELLRTSITPESSAALDYTLANFNLQLGDVEAAKAGYRTAIKKFPNFLRAYKNLGLALVQEGDFEQAREVLVKTLELGDASGTTFGLLAFSYLNLGNEDSALDAYRMAALLMPENKDWKIGKAHSLMQTERYRDAAAIFHELINTDPTNEQFFISRSNALLYLGEYKDAALHLEVVRRMGDANGSILSQLGNLYLNLNNPRLALMAFTDGLTVEDPIETARALKIIDSLLSRYLYEEGSALVASLRDSRGADMTEDETLELLNIDAEISLALGEDEEAASILEKVVTRDPTNGRAFLLLGNYNWNQGNIEEAAYNFEMAQAIEETEYEALVDHARMLVGEADYAEALDLLKRALGLQPRENLQRYADAVERVLERTES